MKKYSMDEQNYLNDLNEQNEYERRKIMSDLVVIGFNDEHTAFEMRAELAKLQKEYLIDMEDVVVVTKDD